MDQELIIRLIELLGTFAFAISGIRHAAAKQFDWFGGYVCGVAVAIGGGTIRDVMRHSGSGIVYNSRYPEKHRFRTTLLGGNHHGLYHRFGWWRDP